eukprot:16602-Eustigmatos_ZCMA.PRE.1
MAPYDLLQSCRPNVKCKILRQHTASRMNIHAKAKWSRQKTGDDECDDDVIEVLATTGDIAKRQ